MRIKVLALMIFARLSWGELNSPVYLRMNRLKFSPPPIVMVDEKSPADYFSRN